MKVFLQWTAVSLCLMAMGSAQPRMEPGEKHQRPTERLERFKKIRMIEALHLDEETGLKLVSRYNSHRDEVKRLEMARSGIIDKIESQIHAGDNNTDLQKSFNELYDIERGIADARKSFLEGLKEILSHKQIAEYMIFEREFMKDLRKVVKDVQKERMRR